jgi:hypothetical protein
MPYHEHVLPVSRRSRFCGRSRPLCRSAAPAAPAKGVRAAASMEAHLLHYGAICSMIFFAVIIVNLQAVYTLSVVGSRPNNLTS